MKRGDLIVGAMRGDYTGKPRPYLIVQADRMLADSPAVTVCPVTTQIIGIGRIRVTVEANAATGLDHTGEVEVDRVTTLRRDRIREIIGSVPSRVMRQVDRSLADWLDL